jgi:hypothetical protein
MENDIVGFALSENLLSSLDYLLSIEISRLYIRVMSRKAIRIDFCGTTLIAESPSSWFSSEPIMRKFGMRRRLEQRMNQTKTKQTHLVCLMQLFRALRRSPKPRDRGSCHRILFDSFMPQITRRRMLCRLSFPLEYYISCRITLDANSC